ncbi:hypothetical protein DES39_0967 [Orbus hercynius]|uniref:VWFA domain-containing protein n=1 Tax=Orbus hercynius TaxID=593135 RepID=A0A495RKN4_9GAMM|nr:hypothetical protein DES39_0967 [Orbus hercynius]
MRLFNSIKYLLIRFTLARGGSVVIIFALLLPFMLAILALYFDSMQLIGRKARLADAINEGIITIANRGETNEDKNKALLTIYLEGYLPQAKEFKNVSVKTYTSSNGCMTYDGQATASVATIVPSGALASFDDVEDVSYKSDACRKKAKLINGDYVFVTDMSASMRGKKLKRLKEILKELVNEGSKTPNTRFAIVPYGNGVPTKLAGKNERGGELYGCSVVFVPKSKYQINYQYWSLVKANNYSKLEKNAHFADRYRYYYYKHYVSPSLNKNDLEDTRESYCYTNKNKANYASGNYEYSCLSDKYGNDNAQTPLAMIFDGITAYQNLTNKTINPLFKNELKTAYEVRRLAAKGRYRNIANDSTIDYQATINRLFIPEGESNHAVVTFPMAWTSTASYYRPFRKMCRMIKGKRKTFANAKIHTHLIELSSNLNAMEPDDPIDDDDEDIDDEEIDQDEKDEDKQDDEDMGGIEDSDIDDLSAGGLTESMSGFMRAVPVITKGKSENKAIILISDGGDNSNIKMRDVFMDKYQICDKVKDPNSYKLYSPNTKKVNIYFIMLASKGAHKKHVKRWAECTGQNNIFYSPNIEDLKDILFNIMTDNEQEVIEFN